MRIELNRVRKQGTEEGRHEIEVLIASVPGGDAYRCRRRGGDGAEEEADARPTQQYSRRPGLPRLCVCPALQRAARARSKDRIERDYFNHGNVGSCLMRYVYGWRTYG